MVGPPGLSVVCGGHDSMAVVHDRHVCGRDWFMFCGQGDVRVNVRVAALGGCVVGCTDYHSDCFSDLLQSPSSPTSNIGNNSSFKTSENSVHTSWNTQKLPWLVVAIFGGLV